MTPFYWAFTRARNQAEPKHHPQFFTRLVAPPQTTKKHQQPAAETGRGESKVERTYIQTAHNDI